jgi:hypothetical protein
MREREEPRNIFDTELKDRRRMVRMGQQHNLKESAFNSD